MGLGLQFFPFFLLSLTVMRAKRVRVSLRGQFFGIVHFTSQGRD